MDLCGAETWALRNVDQKYLGGGGCWNVVLQKDGEDQLGSSCEKSEVFYNVNEEVYILNTLKTRKDNWIGHVLHRNCLLKHVIERKITGRKEVTGGQGNGSKQLLDDLIQTAGYWKLKEEALDRTVWRICFGGDYGPFATLTTGWMNE
jgi:hypothetical protein